MVFHLFHAFHEQRLCQISLRAELGTVVSGVRPDVGGIDIGSLQGAKEDDCILAILAMLHHLGRPRGVAPNLSKKIDFELIE